MSSPSSGSASADTSRRLLVRARLGEPSALGELLNRHLPGLRRWTHGRLPRWVRTMADTSDLIQDAVLHTLRRVDTFEFRGRHALAAYLRAAVRNRVQDEHRRVGRRGMPETLSEEFADPGRSPLDQAMTSEMESRYRAALARLNQADRDLIVAHVELEYTHEQIGCMTGRSPNAARMALKRAVHRLAERMRDG